MKRLERELYYYKKRSRDLKQRLCALQSESEQENASHSISLSHEVEGDVTSSKEVTEYVATSTKDLTVSCNIKDAQSSITQTSVTQSSVTRAKAASFDAKGSKWKPSDSQEDIASLRTRNRDSLDLQERGKSRKSGQEKEEEEEEKEMDECCKRTGSNIKIPNDLTVKGGLKRGTDLDLSGKGQGPTLDVCRTRHAVGPSVMYTIASTEDEIVRKPKKQLRLLRSAAIFYAVF